MNIIKTQPYNPEESNPFDDVVYSRIVHIDYLKGIANTKHKLKSTGGTLDGTADISWLLRNNIPLVVDTEFLVVIRRDGRVSSPTRLTPKPITFENMRDILQKIAKTISED